MKSLPESPDLSHLRRQAKELLRDARAEKLPALERFVATLPGFQSKDVPALAKEQLKLHDAQSVVAREYGFRSWPEMKRFVEWKQAHRAERLEAWLKWIYEGVSGERRLAIRILREEPDFFSGNEWLACATGDEPTLRKMLLADPGWANRPGGPLGMRPLVAVAHSMLILEPDFEPPLLNSARTLLQHGADVNSSWTNPEWPDYPLSALYGAAGKTHHPGMLKLLLDAGANPDDNESLYHSVESRDSTCTRLLLEAGARVAGTNAIGRVLDYGKLDDLRLMLQRGDVTDRTSIHHAILRGRSIEFIRMLIDAGADLRATDRDGISLYRWARLHGRADVTEILEAAGITEPLSEEEQFVAACARGDGAAAREMKERIPDIFSRLNEKQLRALPEHAGIGDRRAVRTMLEAGWPREAKAAWDATALNLAVYRGDAEMADLLLSCGADWRTPHGFGDNVFGTLAYASKDAAEDPFAPGDYLGCARVLIAHNAPVPDNHYTFSPAVEEYFDRIRLRAS